MKMVKAIVRPEKAADVLSALSAAGHNSVTRISILGRGKQRGLKVGDVYYDEIPKEMFCIVCEDSDVEDIVKVISQTARSGKEGAYGDGKIFINPVAQAYTISSGKAEL